MFHVAITADYFDANGVPQFRDAGLAVLDLHPQIQHVAMKEFRSEIGPDQLENAQGIITLNAGVTATTLTRSENLLAIARFGVGYNDIDVSACTQADVLFFTMAGAVDRSMAEATVSWMLALNHLVRAKDLAVREGRWDKTTKFIQNGRELRDHTFGCVGFGRIARATIKLLDGFGMNQPLSFDPLVEPSEAQSHGVRLVGLDELMAEADLISVHCPLNDQTRDLIGRRELDLMKPTAYILNTARGGIINEDALFDALTRHQIAGAAIDVFVDEPFTTPHRFGQLDNILLAPHAVGLTYECYRDIGTAACTGMVDLAQGRLPKSVINPEVVDRPSFQAKWKRLGVSE